MHVCVEEQDTNKITGVIVTLANYSIVYHKINYYNIITILS